MTMIRKHLGFIRNAALVVAICMTVGVIVWLVRIEKAQAIYLEPTAGQVAEAMIRAGLDPASLCAAGVSTETVAAITEAVNELLAESPTALANADSALASARIQEDQLGRLIRSGKATQQQVEAYPSALSVLQSAESQRQAVLDAIFDIGAAEVPTTPRDALIALRTNRLIRGWDLPLPYLRVDRTEAQWVELREALAHERIALAHEEEVDTAIASLLASVRNDQAVDSALALLETSLTAMETEWQECIDAL